MNGISKSVLFVGLAAAPFATGVERPVDLDEKPHQLKRLPSRIEPLDEEQARNWQPRKRLPIVDAIPEERGVEEEAPQQLAAPVVPYLGVGSTPIDELLSGHLGVDHGVVVQQVHEGSGAFKAGLLRNDIILSFDGRKISSPLDLRDAVRSREVGDQVAVKLIRKGKPQQEQVVLETRPQGLPGFVPQGLRGVGRLQPGLQPVWPGGGGIPQDAQEGIDRLRKMFDEEFNDFGLGLKLNQLLDGGMPQGDGQIDLNVDAHSSVTWSDGQGSITMNMREGQTEVKVRDNHGGVVFEGPWDTPQDKAAVEPEIRDRIENMGVQRKGNQLKFWMEGLPGGP